MRLAHERHLRCFASRNRQRYYRRQRYPRQKHRQIRAVDAGLAVAGDSEASGRLHCVSCIKGIGSVKRCRHQKQRGRLRSSGCCKRPRDRRRKRKTTRSSCSCSTSPCSRSSSSPGTRSGPRPPPAPSRRRRGKATRRSAAGTRSARETPRRRTRTSCAWQWRAENHALSATTASLTTTSRRGCRTSQR